MVGFNITGTNHTSFTVSNMDRSLAYFCEVLGFELLNRSPRDISFRKSSIQYGNSWVWIYGFTVVLPLGGFFEI